MTREQHPDTPADGHDEAVRAPEIPKLRGARPQPSPPAPRPSFWRRMGERMRQFLGLPEHAAPPERSVAFTIAVIALGAKMAKADGRVDRAEVAAFRRVFVIPRSEEHNAARVFDLARQDVAGFDAWARRIAEMFLPGDPALESVLECLVIIAIADGDLHLAERVFLNEVARIFRLPDDRLEAILARHDPSLGCPPCDVLGITADTPLEEARARWRKLVRENHPDRAIANGLPPEAIHLAEARTRAINDAWAHYQALHRAKTS